MKPLCSLAAATTPCWSQRFLPARLLRRFAAAALFTVAGAFTASAAESYYFAGFAGDPTHDGSADFRNGGSANSRFDFPTGVALDAAGNIYVADSDNNVIRRISTGGTIATFAGDPDESGADDGTGGNATFNAPSAVAVDGAGNVYVADTGNHTVRKITPGGAVSTLAGMPGVPGSDDGAGDDARFFGLMGIAALADGTLFVSDTGNHTIRVITPGGVVSTLAGVAQEAGWADGNEAEARFAGPTGIAIDATGFLYVADTLNHTIRQLSSSGTVTTVAGSVREPGADDATGLDALFDAPTGVAVNSNGTIYVADSNNHAIRAITLGGEVDTVYGRLQTPGSTNGSNTNARFRLPRSLALTSDGNLIVADTLNHSIRRVNTASGQVTRIAGNPPDASTNADAAGRAAEFSGPGQIAFDGADQLFATDPLSHTIRVVSSAGIVSTLRGEPGEAGSRDGSTASVRFRGPTGLAFSANGDLYVADTGNHTIRVISPDGTVDTFAGREHLYGATNATRSSARFFSPADLVFDDAGNLYVADTGNHVIRRITPEGSVSTYAGQENEPGDNNGFRTSARFFAPSALALADGVLYVADTGNHVIRAISATGSVTTVAGREGSPGTADGSATNFARLHSPDGLAVAADGTIYFSDRGSHVIRTVVNGLVETIAGDADEPGFEGGQETQARFRQPTAIALDAAGGIYIADTGNDTIRRGIRLAGVSGRLTNISVRSFAGSADATVIAGFIVEGAGAKQVLVRGIGPGLIPYDVPLPLPDPQLQVFAAAGGAPIQANDNWGGGTALQDAFNAAGAFALAPDSLDAALVASLSAGGYTAHLTTAGTSGVALIEAYDIDAVPTAEFINVSARTEVLMGAGLLIGGFTITGGPATVLIRGIGPTLADFEVTGALGDPNLELFNAASELIAANADWSEGLEDAFAAVSAFHLPATSRDAALLITLPAGSYTAQVSGAGLTTGIGLVEVYLVR